MKAILCDWCGERADSEVYVDFGVKITFLKNNAETSIDLCSECYRDFIDKCHEKEKEKKK